ncbi:unnamed protein product, partial [Ectocarpus sp. 8 AP-2014]
LVAIATAVENRKHVDDPFTPTKPLDTETMVCQAMHSAAGNNTRKTRTTTLIRAGAVVLMAAVNLSSAATTSATSYASCVCSYWIAKCRQDAVCFACWQAPSTSQSLDCEDRYPGALAGTSCEAT